MCVRLKCEQVDFEEASASSERVFFLFFFKFCLLQSAKRIWALITIGANAVRMVVTPLIP